MNGTRDEARERAWWNIMAALDMPDDNDPEYDRWMFDKAFAAGERAGLEHHEKVLRKIGELCVASVSEDATEEPEESMMLVWEIVSRALAEGEARK